MGRVAASLVLPCLMLLAARTASADVVTQHWESIDKYREKIVLDAAKGDLAAVQRALRHDPELAQWRQIKGSALCEAARGGHLEIVRLLLAHKAPVDSVRAAQQFTPLHCAVEKGDAQIVRLMLEHKPPLEARSHEDDTPLILAARACHLETLKLLLDAGAKLETTGKYEQTALCVAVRAGKVDCITELLRRGANSAVTAYAMGPSQSHTTPLRAAAAGGNLDTVRALLDGGADPNFVDGGRTAIFDAVERGLPELISLLLAAKADANRADNDGMTPLAEAAQSGSKPSIELLLAAKADLSAVDKEGRTPLLHAARNHRKDAALALPEGTELVWSCEPKLDGTSANLLYENGELVRGLSRGDGEVGEDLTANMKTIRNLPLRLAGDGPFPQRIEVRGEIIMSRAGFARLQEREETTSEGTFRNARNTVAGTLKLQDPRIVKRRPLDFIAFGIGHKAKVALQLGQRIDRAYIRGQVKRIAKPHRLCRAGQCCDEFVMNRGLDQKA